MKHEEERRRGIASRRNGEQQTRAVIAQQVDE
jgi:hypothetical protein